MSSCSICGRTLKNLPPHLFQNGDPHDPVLECQLCFFRGFRKHDDLYVPIAITDQDLVARRRQRRKGTALAGLSVYESNARTIGVASEE